MLSINISHLISTRKRGGYNPASQLNLKQYRGKENFTGEVKNTSKSKYRNILNNWFLTNQEQRKQEERKGKAKKINGNQHCICEIGDLSECVSTSYKSKVGLSSLPTSQILFRWLPFNPTSKINFVTLTFPDAPTEEKAKSDLKKYLASARTLGTEYYFWTLEKSGILGDNVHFHLLIQAPDATLQKLASRWDKITNSCSPHSTKSQKVYDHKGMIEYLLKGHEHERLGRQFGTSRPLSDFKPIKLDDSMQADFIEENVEDLRLFAVKDYYSILLPTPKLKQKIIAHYISRCINRKSEKYEKEKLKYGGRHEILDD